MVPPKPSRGRWPDRRLPVEQGRDISQPTLEQLKLFRPSMCMKEYFGHTVVSHTFERTVEMPKHHTNSEYFLPLQTIFMVKARNGGKLNSHLFFFKGFCEMINPVYTVVWFPPRSPPSLTTHGSPCKVVVSRCMPLSLFVAHS